LIAHRLGHALAVGVAEAAQEAPGDPNAEGVDEFLPEQALGHGVEDEGPLAGESDEPALGIDFQEFLEIKLFNSQSLTLD
jgi:hypothetical protein